MFYLGRDICSDEEQASQREWLVTNGIGGYASGTISGMLTRCYHGLLVAALKPPLERTLLLTRLDENAFYAGETYPLFTNRWNDGIVEPLGYRYLEQFRLEGTTPVWTYACADALLEKRIWMEQGANTTCISYTLARGTEPIALSIKALINYRSYHSSTYAADWQMQIVPIEHGMRVEAFLGATPFYLLCRDAHLLPEHTWYRNFWLSMEKQRGLKPYDDNLCAGTFSATLHPGETLTLVASTEPTASLDGAAALEARQHYEQQVLLQSSVTADTPAWVAQLMLAANQFIVRRPTADDPQGQTIIAGYHWFGDWGRDTMISLPGLTLITGQTHVAARILRTFARFVDQGMLPNRFPDDAELPEYNTVDAALWYIEAVRAYHATTADDALLRDLFPVLEDIIAWYRNGTRYNIHVDGSDGLLAAGEAGVQLTWMDAKVEGWVVTPRTGKPIEVNALWYHALCTMAEVAHHLGKPANVATAYEDAAEQVRKSFGRFWNEAAGYCYDVLDGPDGHDDALRPNQVLAVALPHTPLSAEQQRAVVNVCARCLLTSHGLRSLSPDHPDYVGSYGGDPRQRDSSYHQGTVWAWLIGPFINAHLHVYGDPALAQSYLRPLAQNLTDHGVGSISEIFDGEPPFTPRGCIAQAWSVAEVLRAWALTTGHL